MVRSLYAPMPVMQFSSDCLSGEVDDDEKGNPEKNEENEDVTGENLLLMILLKWVDDVVEDVVELTAVVAVVE